MTVSPKTGIISDEEFQVNSYWHEGQKWWYGNDVAICLGYAKASAQKMIAYHVPEMYTRLRSHGIFSSVITKPMDLNDAGVRHLISKRNGEGKAGCEGWFERKAVEGPSRQTSQQFIIRNETDLHYKVVDYLKRFYPQSLTVGGLGELQDTEAKRIDAKRKGYVAGQPDLRIMNSNRLYKAFAIEFKHPGGFGELRDNQRAFLDRLQQEGCKTMVSSDYDEITRAIMAYFEDK